MIKNSLGVLAVMVSLFAGTTDSNAADVEISKNLNRLAFGSCFKPHISKAILHSIADVNPDVFIWGGDSVYTWTF